VLDDGGEGERLYGGGVLAQRLDLKAWVDAGQLATLNTAPEDQSIGVVVPARAYYRYAQISAVGRGE
jgi:hypothetical protein